MKTPQSWAVWLNLGAVVAAAGRDSHHHWLRAARVAWYVLLLPPGSDQQRYHNGDEHGEEQPDHDADDQHQPVVAAVLLPVDLPRHDALGDDVPLRARLPLAAAAVQRNVQDVSAAIVAHADLVYHVRNVRRVLGPASGALTASREKIRLTADGVVFQASLAYAAVSAAARSDSVDGVDVPLSPSGHLQQDIGSSCWLVMKKLTQEATVKLVSDC